jgi:hypothetical protein
MMNGSAIRTEKYHSGAQILFAVQLIAIKFALRLQLPANTHETPEVRLCALKRDLH